MPSKSVQTSGIHAALCSLALLNRLQGPNSTIPLLIVRAYESGDKAASEIWLRSMRDLARGLTSIVNAVDPEIIVLGGGIARAGAALFEPLQRELD